MKHVVLRCAIGLMIATSSVNVEAQNTLDRARILFDAGVQAYTAGRYKEAVESFQEAYALSGKPQAVFSLAQAERRQYLVTLDAQFLKSSIEHFRKYLELVPEGGRRGDAAEALEQLELLATRETKGGIESSLEASGSTGKILISTTTPGAMISIDEAHPAASPVLEAVKLGPHKVRVFAPGYVTETREVVAVEKTLVPVEIVLKEEPAYLKIITRAGASIAIDDRITGEAPLRRPVEVRSGSHTITITSLGFQGRRVAIQITPGQTNTLNLPLERTRQRIVSYVLFGAAGAALIGGAVNGALRFQAQQTSESILEKTTTEHLLPSELTEYNASVTNERRYQIVELSAAAFGGALAAAGAITYFFDSTPPKDDSSTKADNVGVRLHVGPSSAGIGVSGRF